MIKIDPTGHFKNADPAIIKDACGVLPMWAAAALSKEDLSAAQVYDTMVSMYPFYMGPMEGATISPEGVWEYPEDPPLYPLSKQSRGGVSVYIYQYSLVAVTDGEETYMTRMD